MEDQNNLQAVSPEGELITTDLKAEPIHIGIAALEKMEAQLEKLETAKAGIDLDGKYLEFARGQVARGLFLGFKELTKNEGGKKVSLTAAFWMDSGRNIWCNAGAVLVNKMAQYAQGAAVEIEFLGKESTSNGHKVNNFAVRPMFLD